MESFVDNLCMKIAVNIRMPAEMKKVLDAIAESEFRSMNSVILQFIDERLQEKGVEWRKADKKPKK
jgi:hypothetical protein